MNVYGKEPEQLENIDKIFQMVLGDYKIEAIEKAFINYLKEKSEMPTPADIIKIIRKNVSKGYSFEEVINYGR